MSERQDVYMTYNRHGYEISLSALQKLRQGIHYEAYHTMGSHRTVINGMWGTGFVVFAQDALGVSVIGEFNDWNGDNCLMHRQQDSDFFALFLPGVEAGAKYRYEIRTRDGEKRILSDPYGRLWDKDGVCSLVADEVQFPWEDAAWMEQRSLNKQDHAGFSVYETSVFSLLDDASVFSRLKKRGFTHVALCDIRDDERIFSVSRRAEGDEFRIREVINSLHKEGIGVLAKGFAITGERLEYKEIRNYYICNLLYWLEEFHLDGVIISDLAEALYLDYGKQDGEWKPNIYGGNENLEAVEVIKHGNSIAKKRDENVLLLADLDAIWPQVTDLLEDGGLGFDYRYDTDFTKSFLRYLKTDPYFRSGNHEALTERMIYTYCDRFIKAFPGEALDRLWEDLPGSEADRFATIKAGYAYIVMMPGKTLSGFEVPEDRKEAFYRMEADCHKLRSEHPALGAADEDMDNFHWINCFSRNDCMVSFLRKSGHLGDTLMGIANFANAPKQDFCVGVPLEGKYEIVFLSDDTAYGGSNRGRGSRFETTEKECDGFPYSVTLPVEPLQLIMLRYIPYTEEELLKFAVEKAEEIRRQLEEEAREKARKMSVLLQKNKWSK